MTYMTWTIIYLTGVGMLVIEKMKRNKKKKKGYKLTVELQATIITYFLSVSISYCKFAELIK